jgi:hypothetical protein
MICQHEETEPVETLDGETVRLLCTNCLESLPLGWGCSDCKWVEDKRACSPFSTLTPGRPCEKHSSARRLW